MLLFLPLVTIILSFKYLSLSETFFPPFLLHVSHQKRIKDAFASKKRLAKEYEQLAIWFGDCYIGPSQELVPALLPSTTITSTVDLKDSNHISDSEWELL